MAEERLKLLTEVSEISNVEYLIEDAKPGKEKEYRIRGVFMSADTKNRNGRIYPKNILEREVKTYTENYINKKKALGSLDHPDVNPSLKFKNSAILTESLTWDGSNIIGVAKVLSTTDGKELKALMNDGVLISTSSRGLGGLLPDGTVNDSFRLIAVDAVCDASNYLSVTESLIEQWDFVISGDSYRQVAVETFQKDLSKNGTRNLENDLRKFLNELNKKL